MFKIGNKVIIKGNSNYMIDGIINHITNAGFREIFDKIYLTTITSYWKNELIGEIFLIGKWNHYVIKSKDCHYVFNNDYDEMTILVEVSNEIFKKRF